MSRQFLAAVCVFDGLLTLLFTQAGMFFIGKTHADVSHGLTPQPLAFGMYSGNIGALGLLLAAALACHGLWSWRKYRTMAPQARLKPLESVVVATAPLLGALIGITLASVLVQM